MKRRRALFRIVSLALVLLQASGSRAQSSAGRTVIGLLDAGERPEWWDAFRKQLRERGYVEGRNVRFEPRYAKGKPEALPAMAADLVRLKVAVIVTGGAAAAVAARRATSKIPIVMTSGADQWSPGLAASPARPGGNVTGVSFLNADLMAKRFGLLREVAPKASRLAALWHGDDAPSTSSVRALEGAAARSKVALQSLGIRSAEELTEAFSAMARERIEALVVVNSPFLYAERRRVAELAVKQKIPAIYGSAEYVEAGGLMSYAPSYPEMFRHAAIYVDKILQGANPATMPIDQPTVYELVLNPGAARAIGITIPSAMQARASRVIQ